METGVITMTTPPPPPLPPPPHHPWSGRQKNRVAFRREAAKRETEEKDLGKRTRPLSHDLRIPVLQIPTAQAKKGVEP